MEVKNHLFFKSSVFNTICLSSANFFLLWSLWQLKPPQQQCNQPKLIMHSFTFSRFGSSFNKSLNHEHLQNKSWTFCNTKWINIQNPFFGTCLSSNLQMLSSHLFGFSVLTTPTTPKMHKPVFLTRLCLPIASTSAMTRTEPN